MTLLSPPQAARRKAVWGPKRTAAALVLIALGLSPSLTASSNSGPGNSGPGNSGSSKSSVPSGVKQYKLDDDVLRLKDANPLHTSSVIVRLVRGAQLPPQFKKFVRGRKLDIINGHVLDLPNGQLKQLEAQPEVFRVHFNRPIGKENYRTSVTVGAATVRQVLGYTGAGVGVAVIDSGTAAWHDDLTRASSSGPEYPYGNQRVSRFIDFVNGQSLPYDDNGHGSHVAGIIAGNGYDSKGEKSGIAPDAALISLKVLDSQGKGTISNIIAALNWIAANHSAYNIRVVNMSVGASIRESYWTDPLTLATKVVTDKGVTVVAAAGNIGRNAQGQLQYGGITAPGNAPWVLTVGASSTNGSLTRRDDTLAGYSSAGPTFIDHGAKPDLVAPGTGTISLAVPGSTLSSTKAHYLVDGKPVLGFKPYLALSGTSMAAPVVTGTVALMLQANPNLTPNLIKAILQYTAEVYPGYNALRQGAGFLNSLGAVRLANFYAVNRAGERMPVQRVWSRQIIWGNHRITGGYINPQGNAWATTTIWGAAKAANGIENVIWGTECVLVCDNIIWGTSDVEFDNTIWSTTDLLAPDNIIWGTTFVDDNVIWGTTTADDNIVWGTDCGGADCDNTTWGLPGADNIIWGTMEAGDNVIWGTTGFDNIIWATSGDQDVTWGSASDEEVIYPDSEEAEPPPDISLEFGEVPLAEPTTSEDTTLQTTEPLTSTTSVLGGGL